MSRLSLIPSTSSCYPHHPIQPAQVDHALTQTLDTHLTDEGVAQALRAHEGLPGDTMSKAEVIFSSPLTRAMQTSGLIRGSWAMAADGWIS